MMTWNIWDQDVDINEMSSTIGKFFYASVTSTDSKGLTRCNSQLNGTIVRVNDYEGVVINAPESGGEVMLTPPRRRSEEGIPYEQLDSASHALCEKIYDVAVKYYKSKKVENADVKAFNTAKNSAQRGHAPSQFLIAMFYTKGIGIRSCYIEALKWFRRAAAQDHAKAQYNLANMYISGKGTQRDDAEAFYWYSRAATNGIEQARKILKSRRTANEVLSDMMSFKADNGDVIEQWEFYVPSYSYDRDYDGKLIHLSGRMLRNRRSGTFQRVAN